MNTKTQLVEHLSDKHLLKHPFYEAWNAGELKKEDLQFYSRQYYQFVKDFPRFVSATHSKCEDLKARQFLLENLIEEEKGTENHPELWLRFVEGLQENRENAIHEKPLPETQELTDIFFKRCLSSYAEGLGALFAYEHQVPEVSITKIEGLKKFYQVEDQRSIQFFEAHIEADEFHSQSEFDLIQGLPEEDRKKALEASRETAEALWKFLDGIQNKIKAAA